MNRRTRSSLEKYVRDAKVDSNRELRLQSFKAAYASIERCIYLTPLELVSTLQNKTVWPSFDKTNELERSDRDAFVEIIIASAFEVEISQEGLPIFVLKNVIRSEELYFQQIISFLKTFLEIIKMREFPLHVRALLKHIEIHAEIDCVDNYGSSPREDDFDGSKSPDRSSSHTDTSSTSSSLSSMDINYHRLISNENKNCHYSRQILIYLPNELRRFDRANMRNEKINLTQYDRFLANLRKVGMDILFPRESHDKLLSFIYAFLTGTKLSAKTLIIDENEELKRSRRSKNIKIPYETTEQTDNDGGNGDDLQIPILRLGEVHALTHKEMIDTVIHYQKSNDDFGGVTKTKTRGVLALLKHASAIDSFTPINDSVQITLNASVHDFRDVRVLHDRYLIAAAKEFEIELTREEWQTLIWDDEETDQCLSSCVDQVQQISKYLSTLSPSIFEELANESALNAVDDGSYSSNEKRCNKTSLSRHSYSAFSDNLATAKSNSLEQILELDPTILLPTSPAVTVDSQLTESPGFYQSMSNVTDFAIYKEHDFDVPDLEVLSENNDRKHMSVENCSSSIPRSFSAESLGSSIFAAAPLSTNIHAQEENEDPRVVGSPISFKGKIETFTGLKKKRGPPGLGALANYNVQNHLNIEQASPKQVNTEENLDTEQDDRFHAGFRL